MIIKKIIPVILCGGSGSRLWPLSRMSYPKQYISLINSSKLSLLQQTVLRILSLENVDNPIFICNEEHRFLVAEQMREISITPKLNYIRTNIKKYLSSYNFGCIKSY